MQKKYAFAIIDPETTCEHVVWLAGPRLAREFAKEQYGSDEWYEIGWPPKWE